MRKFKVDWPTLPKNCGNCPLYWGDTNSIWLQTCPVTNESVSGFTSGESRPESCPVELKEQKK